ncbi:hypothetical protein PF006_g29340 [Phytophthora fragariae]|uniref:PEP-utilising enzyme C-terminal domain-containing protein n=2 Tax=Phytophthora fragariae TaxID=53985 RepID=A0A6A3Q7I0_9STRA|nr:hypothetical protein PF009_g30006 [Phytophthora fragariae]KAE9070551.1 hypothetical protein PF006_g29340 [Phytophthora fragariae]
MRGDLEQFMKWLDVYHRIEAFMNADTLKNAREARAHSALGIGLTCTEPMLIISAQLIAAPVHRTHGITEILQAKPIAEVVVMMAGGGISVHQHVMISLVDSFEELERFLKLLNSIELDVIGKSD